MPDGTATFDGMFHHMEMECKNKRGGDGGEEAAEERGRGGTGSGSGSGWNRRCQQEYGSALYMTPEEKQISFYNRYFIFRKNRNINAKQLKSSFLSYAGLQEEQDRAASAVGGEEDVADIAALEKIAKASRPMDVASKPAIAAHILAQRDAEKQMEAITGDTGKKAPTSAAATATTTTLKIKPKPKPKLKTTATTVKAAASAAVAAAAEEEASSAPIAQIEKKIQKRTKKVKMAAEKEGPAAAPKRQTKKKTDL